MTVLYGRRGSAVRFRRRIVGMAFALLSLVGATVILPPRAASGDPLDDARAKAAALRDTVARLQLQAEQASERYDAAEAQLADLVVRERAAQLRADAARSALDAAQATLVGRIRALYMAGGTLGMYATVLSGGNPAQILTGLHDVAVLSTGDRHALQIVQRSRAELDAAAAAVAALVQQHADLLAAAAAAEAQVQQALAEQQAALDAATAQVRALEAELEAQLEAQRAAEAAAALAAARQAALRAGYRPPPPSRIALAAIAAAETQLGKPYAYGGSGPDSWDCSGLTQFAYRQAGVFLPRTAAEQFLAVAEKVPLGELIPGDLLFWATDPTNPATIHHVAIYLGDGRMLAAPHTGTVVQIQDVYLDGYFGAVRPG